MRREYEEHRRSEMNDNESDMRRSGDYRSREGHMQDYSQQSRMGQHSQMRDRSQMDGHSQMSGRSQMNEHSRMDEHARMSEHDSRQSREQGRSGYSEMRGLGESRGERSGLEHGYEEMRGGRSYDRPYDDRHERGRGSYESSSRGREEGSWRREIRDDDRRGLQGDRHQSDMRGSGRQMGERYEDSRYSHDRRDMRDSRHEGRGSHELSLRDHDLGDYDYGEYRRDAARHDLGSRHEQLDHEREHRSGQRGRESYGMGGYHESDHDRHRSEGGLSGRGSERHDSRERDSRDAEDFEQYRGRDYGFSWVDGSNDATWRNFDKWGNEYSNHSRSEGFGWNRGSTRDPQFWSSPDRER